MRNLASRFPRSGGVSFYCQRAFGSDSLALLVGWLVLCSGIVSLATVSRAFVGYLSQLFIADQSSLTEPLLLILFLATLGGINFWGIQQSSKTNIVCTAIEASGLLLVLAVGIAFLVQQSFDPLADAAAQPSEWPAWTAIGQAAAIAFFAFIGFEDMVNVAEEVRSPHRTLPLAIISALLIAGSIYIAVVAIATSVVPPAELSASQAPLLKVVERSAPAFPPMVFTVIALFAVANTGLLNFIMASRLLYGMADQRLMPAWFGQIHPYTRTPHWSIAIVFGVALLLAWSGSVKYLAGTTSMLLLTVFFSTHLALAQVKRRNGDQANSFRIPIAIPVLGCIATVVLFAFVPAESMTTGAILMVAGIVVVYLRTWHRPPGN